MKNEKVNNNLPLENDKSKKEWYKPEINKITEINNAESTFGPNSDLSISDS